jgi:hypothetical protein
VCTVQEFYRCLLKRVDALFELTDTVLCTDGPVRSLAGKHRRGHGGGYAALARGRVDIDRLRTALTAVSLPRAADGRLVLAVDVTCWLRPEAHTCAQRILCHSYGRGKDQHMTVPGWPYLVIVALETGRGSWTAPLDAVRLAPGDNAANVTVQQIRDVVDRLTTAGHWSPGIRTSCWSPTPATTAPAWRTSWPTCRSPCWSGCAPTGSCTARSHHSHRAR